MSRKTHLTGAVAIGATLIAGIASAEISGANAQAAIEQEAVEAQATAEVVPAFVSEEVVQPLPDETETNSQDATEASDAPQADSLHELVSQIDAPQSLSREMECLAGTVYFESRGEPLAGQLAVAQVVINRAESDVFPESYCGVVHQRKQFSFIRGGRMPNIARSTDAWQRAKKIARIAHEGLWDSEAKDSLYFHANYVSPRWARTKQARATIKTHTFYR
ncbi:cell wall hydrolase [Erythrobacter sp. HKB08]|uniref:cell wall hydrolase n=1 Tax=Erythrobacter sp. HKB08 TaxID=2502843 RepID=UPI0010088D56|nr:cell wall hydrolase [Erythrobacter sp. HKB08]